MNLQSYLEEKKRLVDSALEKWFPPLEEGSREEKFLFPLLGLFWSGGRSLRKIARFIVERDYCPAGAFLWGG